MKREDYAKDINYKGSVSREIQVDSVELVLDENEDVVAFSFDGNEYMVGSTINPGLCWSDGGEFRVENTNNVKVIFTADENTRGHAVAYENEAEVEDLGAVDCEAEVIIDSSFEIVDFTFDLTQDTDDVESLYVAVKQILN